MRVDDELLTVGKILAAATAVVVTCFIFLLIGAVFWMARAQTGQHGDGHAEMHDIYKNWHPPYNAQTSCCNNADCRSTRAFVAPDGQWRAFNGRIWLRVPPDRILPSDYAGDGRSHLCEGKRLPSGETQQEFWIRVIGFASWFGFLLFFCARFIRGR